MTKLNKKRVKWLVDQVVQYGKRPSTLCTVYGVTERRVQQLVQAYRQAKKYPELKKQRRPKTFLSEEQQQLIDTVFTETRLNQRMLYYELQRRGTPVAKNKLYQYMKWHGFVRDEPAKQKKRKRCRYEREHTGSLVHADFHRTSEHHPHCIIWLDDASRRILSGGEFSEATAEHAIATFQHAERELKKYDEVIHQVNTDRGPQFCCNKGDGISQFEQYCLQKGIDFIPSRRNNPQTNGKVERRWLEYDRHRWRFNSFEEWTQWHNNRLTTALDIEHYETPNDAFLRKLPNTLALFWKRMES